MQKCLYLCSVNYLNVGGGSGFRAVLKRQLLLSLKCVGGPTLAPDEQWRQLHTLVEREEDTQQFDEAHNSLQSPAQPGV